MTDWGFAGDEWVRLCVWDGESGEGGREEVDDDWTKDFIFFLVNGVAVGE